MTEPTKINRRLVYLLENWLVEQAIQEACEAWEQIEPGQESDLMRALVGAEDNLPMSEDDQFDLRKIALGLADELAEVGNGRC